MSITSKIIADSVNKSGKRITTFEVTYPRFIHAEIMTHRQLSRNAASSRAIPIDKVIESVKENPALPEWWGQKQSGMQADGQVCSKIKHHCQQLISNLKDQATWRVKGMEKAGLHKQIANRYLEPWFHITVLITATEWDNFFGLRAHAHAQPEFQVLAYRMLNDYLSNDPEILEDGEWHLPFADKALELYDQKIQSAASAARVSYTSHRGEFPIEKQRDLVNKLVNGGHWSPFEHQAMASGACKASGNFKGGWLQYRHTFATQEKRNLNLQEILDNRPTWFTL